MNEERLNLPAAVSIVVSSMIGVGVFTSVGFQLAAIPSAFPILLLWGLGGIVSLCGALCYAELLAMWPRSGGEYHLLRQAYHPAAGFLAGWISITAGFAAPLAALGLACGEYAKAVGLPISPPLTAATIILALAVWHLGPLRWVGGFLTVATALKLALIAAFLVGAWLAPSAESASLAPRPGDWGRITSPAFAISMVYVLFSYSGWNGAAYVASELRDPARLTPRALLLGTGIVTAVYLLLNAVFLARAPWDRLAGHVEAAVIAGESLFGKAGARAAGAVIAGGLIATLAGYTWAGSRVTDCIGQDFPRLRWLAVRNRWGAPYAAVTVQSLLALFILATGTFDAVVHYLMALLQLCSVLVVIAVAVERCRRPDAPRPFRVPFYPVPLLIFSGVTIWVLAYQILERPAETAAGAATLVIGLALYAWASRPLRTKSRAS